MGVLDTLSGLRLRRSGQRSGFEQQLNLSSAQWGGDVVENQDLQGVPSQKWALVLAAVIYHFVEAPKQDYNTSPSQVTPSWPWGVPDYI